MNTEIKDVMSEMPHTIGHDISVKKAREMMREYKCHHLPVLDGGQLVGLLSERDLRVAESFSNGDETIVEQLMTDEPVVVNPTTQLKEVVNLMMDKKIGSVIVSAQSNQSWGIFTTTDILKLFVKTM